MTLAVEDVQRLLQAAGEAHRAGRPADAARNFEHILEIDPANAVALNSLGVRALEHGDGQLAADLFKRATAGDPAAPALWMNLAKAHRLLGDSVGEAASLDRALETDQRHFMALVRRAELHERLGEDAQAAMRWSAVLALARGIDPRPPALEEMLAHARDFVGAQMRDFEAAIKGDLDAATADVAEVELRRFNAAVAHALGKRPIYQNECAGLHFPFLPADEYFDRHLFPWISEVEAASAAIREEFERLVAEKDAGFEPYVAQDPGTPRNKWSELDRSLDWSAYYLWQYGKRNEAACARCPATAAMLDALPLADLPGRAPTAFFSLLRPKTRIPPHTGVSNTRTIIHLPLVVPDGCGFRVGGETRQWRVGEAFAFDDTIEHEAWNDSDELRAVLIFDVWNPHLTETEQRLLRTFYAAADASGHNPEPQST